MVFGFVVISEFILKRHIAHIRNVLFLDGEDINSQANEEHEEDQEGDQWEDLNAVYRRHM
jgi:hypothetical protein